MADLILDARVDTTEFTIAPWAPGQTNVVAPYRPATLAAGPTQTGWSGTVRLAPRTGGDGNWALADRELVALRGRMRGNRHRVRIPLPKAFAGRPPPEAASTALTSAVLRDGAARITVTPNAWGSWLPEAGSYFNIGDALYLIDSYEAGGVINALPGVIPLGLRRPRGIFPIPGGGSPAGVLRPSGMGQYRGSLYTTDLRGGDADLYWIDVASGTRREVRGGLTRARSLSTVFGNLYYNEAGGRSSTIRRFVIDLADPSRNTELTVITFTGLPGGTNNRIQGMAEWQAPDDDGPKLYAGIVNKLYRATMPPTDANQTLDWDTYWEEITGPTGFTTIAGLSAGPNPDDPLYILDRGGNTIWTWDGTQQREWATGTVGAQAGPNVVSLSNCYSIEWYRGNLYVGAAQVGTVAPGVHRVNWDTPTTARDISFVDPYVWARLEGGPAGPTGRHFPPTTFSWTEVPTQ